MTSTDFLVIGGGIIGLSVARELKHRFPNTKVTLLEKEMAMGLHASGRNSGIIHAGFYYSADSLKAKLTRAGNQAMTRFCEERSIPVNRCGKLIVAQNEADLPQLDELLRRGSANQVPLESLSEKEARQIEPRVKTYQRAIFSPTTSSSDPRRVLQAMQEDAIAEGLTLHTCAPYVRREKDVVVTSRGRFCERLCSRHTSVMATPLSAPRNMPIFSSVVYRLPFICRGPFFRPRLTLPPAQKSEVTSTINGHGLRELILIAYFTEMGITVGRSGGSGVREIAIAFSLLLVADDLLWSIPGGIWYMLRFKAPAARSIAHKQRVSQ
jgi:hypothetical protein